MYCTCTFTLSNVLANARLFDLYERMLKQWITLNEDSLKTSTCIRVQVGLVRGLFKKFIAQLLARSRILVMKKFCVDLLGQKLINFKSYLKF